MDEVENERYACTSRHYPWLSQPEPEASTLLWKLKDCFSTSETNSLRRSGDKNVSTACGCCSLSSIRRISKESRIVRSCSAMDVWCQHQSGHKSFETIEKIIFKVLFSFLKGNKRTFNFHILHVAQKLKISFFL